MLFLIHKEGLNLQLYIFKIPTERTHHIRRRNLCRKIYGTFHILLFLHSIPNVNSSETDNIYR